MSKQYIVAVNEDESYPLLRTSHMKNGHSHAEVQQGYLTFADVIPDGQIIIHPVVASLYLKHKTWEFVSTLTWGQLGDHWMW